jgi:PAS domain S-box-containing protein
MKINFSIRSFLVFLAISFTVPAVLLFGYFEALNGVRQAREQAKEMNRQAALLIQHDIGASLQEFKAFTEGLALDVDPEKLRIADENRVNQVLKAYPGFAFLLLNEHAVSVAAYAGDRQIQVGLDYSDRPYVKQAFFTRQTVVSGAIQSRTANRPAVVFLVPLITADGPIKGFLGGGVPTAQFRTGYELAPEQFAMILDTYGEPVSAINAKQIERLAADIARMPAGQSRLRTGQTDSELYLAEVKPIGWKVIVGLPHEYVMARARQAIYNAMLVALVCALIGGAVASVVGFSTVKGLDKIGRQVQAMSAVDLRPVTLSETGLYPREVRSLIGNFNNLIDRTARLRLAEFEAVSRLADAVLIVWPDGQIIWVNEAGIKMFGDVIGHSLKEIIAEETLIHVLSQETPKEWKGDALVVKSDRTTFDGFLSSTPVFEDGKFTSAIIIIQDITREKAAREAMAQSEKMITLGELVAGTSHELNNPLAIVTGYADLLLDEKNLDGEQRAKVESIRKNAHRAANVVHSLLAFARKRKPVRVETQINSVVEAALQLKEYDLRTSGILIDRDLAANLPPVFADPNQIQQVLLNVFNNAQDAVMAGSQMRRWIRIATRLSGVQVVVKVEDTGAGIAKDDIKKVFDPFFTTKPIGKGTGLGLSISYGIVREHGGDIEIQSQVGRGTQVSIALPAYTPLPRQTAPQPVVRRSMLRRRFLIVDDEVELTAILQRLVVRGGSSADTAANLEEALRLAKANEYDFIITDIKMPGGSGIELYRELCRLKPSYRHRVLFLTGDTSNPATIQFLEQEALAYFSKPFDFQAMELFLTGVESPAMPS